VISSITDIIFDSGGRTSLGYNLDGFCKELAGILISSKNPSDTR